MKNNNEIAVSVSKLEKRFGDFTAVNKIDFEVKKGEIFGFLGPNGAGKSTTIRMLCGIITPSGGSGTVAGFDIINQQEEIKENIGYMSQKFSLYDDLTVEENINFYSGIYKISEADKSSVKENIIKMAGIEDFRHRLTSNLSGGWKQRLALGCAIMHNPKIIFLDEPTSGVDPITRANFWAIIKDMANRGTTVFITTHYMDEAENCDRMTLIYRGNIIAMGSPLEMRTNYMKDDVLEVSLDNAEDWVDKLTSVPAVKESALFSTKIHVITSDTKGAIDGISSVFNAGSVRNFSIKKIPPSLEDVFVSSIERYDKEHAS